MAYAYAIPFFPLLAFLVIIFNGKRLHEKAAWVAVAGCLTSAALSTVVGIQVIGGATYHHSFDWVVIGETKLNFGILIDSLTAMMLFVVTWVGSLIFIYSMGYMHGDPRYSRFFAYLSLFMFSMLGLTLANHYLQLYIFWELVGLCSYLLISFWFEKPAAANAGRKAFITTRVGDVGLFLGILLLYKITGTLQFKSFTHEFLAGFSTMHAAMTAACILIFLGACGKSAQFPLHVWLPDAMEGPTSVSALIHAATMVAAGVYLVARSFPIFSEFAFSLDVVAVIGTITACMAAFIALTANDIKKVLAYSTISQLGYMMAALGLGGYSAGTFHLMTHAFFKALLFLGAGSVIHGAHTQDIREMGGLFPKMKITALTFLVASLAIAGVPPLSGFYSKDEILLAAYNSGNKIIYWALVVTAFMTAFYMFRLYILTFLGKPRNEKVHAHESPAVMTVPLSILAVFAAVIGIPGSPFMHHWFHHFIHGGHAEELHPVPFVIYSSIGAAGGGILIAILFYLLVPKIPVLLGTALKPLYVASANKLWFDELYQAVIIKPVWALGRLLFKFDEKVVDGAVNQSAIQTVNMSGIQNWVDKNIVDAAVNGVGAVTQAFSAVSRKIQTGLIQNYLFVLVIGFILAIIVQMK